MSSSVRRSASLALAMEAGSFRRASAETCRNGLLSLQVAFPHPLEEVRARLEQVLPLAEAADAPDHTTALQQPRVENRIYRTSSSAPDFADGQMRLMPICMPTSGPLS